MRAGPTYTGTILTVKYIGRDTMLENIKQRKYAVGEGVTAVWNGEDYSIELYSDGGTLWWDWMNKGQTMFIEIESIRVAKGSKVYLPENMSGADRRGMYRGFGGLPWVSRIDMNGFDTSKVKNMRGMFENCSALEEISLNGCNVSNVETVQDMFRGCNNLRHIDLSGTDLSKVTRTDNMFFECESLTEVDVSPLYSASITRMDYMFYKCQKIKEIDLSGFDMSNVQDISHMFGYCTDLQKITMQTTILSGTKTEGIFEKCSQNLLIQCPE